MGKFLYSVIMAFFFWCIALTPISVQAGPGDGEQELGKILGGQDADIRNWPWTVALVHGSTENVYRGQFCGGTLISGHWVVTAAHCVTDGDGNLAYGPGDVHVVNGRTNLYAAEGDRIAVSEYIVHPQYNPQGNESDLALLRLEREPAQGTIWGTLPVIPPGDPAGLTNAGNPSWVVGWGALGPDGGYPAILQQAQVPLASQVALIAAYPPPFFAITANMIGAGPGDGTVDTCQGDSGGPLMVRDGSGNFVLAGVTSWGLQCGTPGIYGVYVRLANYCGWIKSHTGVGDCDSDDSGGGCSVAGARNPGGEWLLLFVFLVLMTGRAVFRK